MSYSCPYVDDADLDGSLAIFRAVHPQFVDWSQLSGLGMPEMQSRVFQEASPELAAIHGYDEPAVSIGFEHILSAHGLELDDFLGRDRSDWGVAKLTIAHVRVVIPSVGVSHDRRGSEWHGILFAISRIKMKSERSQLRDRAV